MRRFLLNSIFFLFTFFVFSQDPNFNECKKAMATLDDVVSRFTSFKGKFVHTISSIDDSFKQSEEGYLYLEKGKMKWEYTNPEGKIALYDGKYAYLYIKEDNTLYKIKVSSRKKIPFFLKILLGEIKPSTKFFCANSNREDDLIKIELGYEEKEPSFRRVSVTVNEREKFLRQISFINEFDERVTFDFLEGETGTKFKDETFSISSPAGTKTIEDTESFQENLGF